ncbi:hypothetical protein ACOSQ2_002140 [Xanthoceras sorbifolium]
MAAKPTSLSFSTSSVPLFSTFATTTAATPVASNTNASLASTAALPAFGVSSSLAATAASTPPSASSTAATTTSSFTGFSMTSTATSSGTSGSFTGFSMSTKTATPASSSQSQSITAAPVFGVPPSTSAASTTSSSSTPAAQTSLSLVAASTSGASTSVSGTVSAIPKLPSEITGRTVEEIIKEWNAELQEHTGKFRKQASAVADWEKRILQNRDVLLRHEIEVAKVVETQCNLGRQLELIKTHQQEVDKALQSMEEEAEHIYKDEGGLLLDDEAASTRDEMYEQAESVERELEHMTEQIKSIIRTVNANQVDKALQSMEEEAEHIYKDEGGLLLDDEAASTRDAMYEQAESVERELEHMTEQIKSIVQTVNANQGGELDTVDGLAPFDVVVRILNNQLSSLMWIEYR